MQTALSHLLRYAQFVVLKLILQEKKFCDVYYPGR